MGNLRSGRVSLTDCILSTSRNSSDQHQQDQATDPFVYEI
jgi:hypothetical protein